MIDVALTLEEVRGIPLAGVTAVVLDVVRASTTIVAALAGGARAVVPVATPDEARALGPSGRPGPGPDRRRAGRRAAAGIRLRQLPGRVHAGPRPRAHGRLHDDERHPGPPRPGRRPPDRGRRIRQRRGGRQLGGGRAGRRPPGLRRGAGPLLPGGRGLRGAPGLAAGGRRRRARPTRRERPGALWERYANDLDAMLADAAWAQALVGQGRGSDLPLCVALDVHGVVPVLRDGALVAASDSLTPLGAPRHNDSVRRTARRRRVNLPTQLTVGRICLVPLVVAFLISNESTHALVAAVLFVGAALTDWLDGLIARRRGQVTTLGKLLDPVADKVLVSAALISLVQVGTVEAWMVVIVIGREFAVTGLRSVSAAQGLVIEASDLGKYKTFSQYLAVTLLILERSVPSRLRLRVRLRLARDALGGADPDGVLRHRLLRPLLSRVRRRLPGPRRRSLALSALWLLGAYLVGAIPVGYVVARILGIDIRQQRQRQHRRDQRPPHRGLDAGRRHAARRRRQGLRRHLDRQPGGAGARLGGRGGLPRGGRQLLAGVPRIPRRQGRRDRASARSSASRPGR